MEKRVKQLFTAPDYFLVGTECDHLLKASKKAKFILMKRSEDPFPQPVKQFGTTRRWLASEVYAWLARQAASSVELLHFRDPPRSPKPPKDLYAKTAVAIDVQKMADLYCAGASLDELCREFQVGKQRLSISLREEGVKMRPPGRKRHNAPSANTSHALRSSFASARADQASA